MTPDTPLEWSTSEAERFDTVYFLHMINRCCRCNKHIHCAMYERVSFQNLPTFYFDLIMLYK